jgi:hypothetical protein
MIDNFWLHPESYVDDEDIIQLHQLAYTVLKDTTVTRVTEFSTWSRLFRRAYQGGLRLTNRQERALQLEYDALRRDMPRHKISSYVAGKLGCHRDNAKRILNRAHARETIIYIANSTSNYKNIVGSSANHAYGYEALYTGNQYQSKQITSDRVNRILYNTWIDCPTIDLVDDCLGRSRGLYVLCPVCHEHYKSLTGGLPEWVEMLRDDRRQELRQSIRDNYHTMNFNLEA